MEHIEKESLPTVKRDFAPLQWAGFICLQGFVFLVATVYSLPYSSYSISRCDELQLKWGAFRHSPLWVP